MTKTACLGDPAKPCKRRAAEWPPCPDSRDMTDRPAARLSTFEMVCHIVASGRTVRYIRPVCHGIDTRASRKSGIHVRKVGDEAEDQIDRTLAAIHL
jgi:hypothetical protein